MELPQHELPAKSERRIKDYLFYPFLKVKSYFVRINRIVGWKFIVFLFVSQMFIKGMLYRILTSIVLPLFKNLGVGVVDLQIYTTVIMSPWTVKPIIGVLSDLISILGYHKRYWMFQASIVGVIFGFLIYPSINNPMLIVVCFIGLNYEMSVIDLLTEARYAKYMQNYPDISSEIMTFVTGLQTIGSMVSLSFIGHLSDLNLFWILFTIILVLAITPLAPIILGFLDELKVNDNYVKIDKNLFHQHKSTFIVILFTGLSGPVLGFLMTFLDKKFISLICASVLLLASIIGSFMAFPRVVAQIGLYQVLIRLSKPSISTPLDYFFTATPECLPDGPHFSFKYYISFTGFASSCIAFFAVWLYQIWLSKWKFRTVLIFTTCLVGIGGSFDLLIVLRVNEKLGIPDHVFYFFGDAIFETVVEMLFWLPSSIIIAKSCPAGMESAIYAFLAGISNFGNMLSELIGAMLFEAAGITKCNFDSLWWLILCFHIILPIIGGVPAAYLVPNGYQDGRVIEKDLIPEYSIRLKQVDGGVEIVHGNEKDDDGYLSTSSFDVGDDIDMMEYIEDDF